MAMNLKAGIYLRVGVAGSGWLCGLFTPNVVKAVELRENRTTNVPKSSVKFPHCEYRVKGLCIS